MFRRFKQWKLDRWRKRQSNKVVLLPTTFNVSQVAEAMNRIAEAYSHHATTAQQVMLNIEYYQKIWGMTNIHISMVHNNDFENMDESVET